MVSTTARARRGKSVKPVPPPPPDVQPVPLPTPTIDTLIVNTPYLYYWDFSSRYPE